MRVMLILAGLAVLTVVALITVVVMDSPDVEDEQEVSISDPTKKASEKTQPHKPPGQIRKQAKPAKDPEEEKRRQAMRLRGKKVDEKNVMQFGQEFEDKWKKDKQQLGAERHSLLEDLWFEGRRPRGNPASREKLEKILEDYPDSNRAGCAAIELGYHWLRSPEGDINSRRKKAEDYWKMTQERYSDSLCEYNSHPAAISKLALAVWVYRYSDRGMAKRLLQEVIDKHPNETDHLAQPLSQTAERFLKALK